VSTIESKRQSVLAAVLFLFSNLFLDHTDSSTDGIGQYCRPRIASPFTLLIGDNSGLSILLFTDEYYCSQMPHRFRHLNRLLLITLCRLHIYVDAVYRTTISTFSKVVKARLKAGYKKSDRRFDNGTIR
jgi:hypothetical protein